MFFQLRLDNFNHLQKNNINGFSLIEYLIIITILGITWKGANLASAAIKNTIYQNSEFKKIKLALEEQIIYANTTKQKVQIIQSNNSLVVLGNKFTKEIKISKTLYIQANENRLSFYPKQVCSPANISYQNLSSNCILIISLRCRIRIEC